MNTTSIHIKIETDIKKQAQKAANELGLSLSSVTKVLLKQFIRTKHLSVGVNEVPNRELLRSLTKSDKDIKAGRVTTFKNGNDALVFLDREIAHEKRSRTNR